MCECCKTSPCLHGCPNEDEPNPIHKCDHCKNGIYEGDKFITYWRSCSKYIYCEDCYMEVLTESELNDAETEIAEPYDDWW